LTSSDKAVYLESCGALVVSTNQGSKIFLVDRTKETFEQITSVDSPFDLTTFSCFEESDGKYLLTTQVSGSSTVKVWFIVWSMPYILIFLD